MSARSGGVLLAAEHGRISEAGRCANTVRPLAQLTYPGGSPLMGDRTCSTPGCNDRMAYVTRGLCRRCYDRARGAAKPKVRPALPNIDRFEKRVNRIPGGCWEWVGHTNGGGYGRLAIEGRTTVYAHRWSYEYHVGPIPDGLEIDHLCRNTLCVNPDHLEPVTPDENKRRWSESVTHCKSGHEYTPENTYIRPGRGGKDCMECRRERDRKRRPAGWRKAQAA